MYRWLVIATIVLAATSTNLATFLDVPALSYGQVVPLVTKEPVPPTELRTNILFTGDLMLARRVETILDREGSEYVYARLRGFASSTDWFVTNFEAAVPATHIHTPDLTFRFSVDEAHLAALRAFGVTHASLANNHSYDAGVKGYQESLGAISRNAITAFGDIRVATNTVSVLPLEHGDVAVFALYAVDTSPDLAALSLLMDAYGTTSYQIAYIHWGTEYSPVHVASTEALARDLVNLGFDAIIGHHPHVVQDIGLIDGVPVFYSLGNFIFDQYFSPDVQQGLVLRVQSTSSELIFELMPHTSTDVRSQPRRMTENEEKAFLTSLAAKSDPSLYDEIMAGILTFSRYGVANSP